MNHLCGLTNLGGDIPSPSDLSGHERDALNAFRRRYDSALLRAHGVNDGDADGEEKKELSFHDSSHVSSIAGPPIYEINSEKATGASPPSSGLRPLDDVTLYRYLVADRKSNGTFDEDASYRRLIAALQFRREVSSDDIVSAHVSSSTLPSNVQACQRMRVTIWAGTDNEQRPVVFERLGQFFGSGNVARAPTEDWITSYLYFLERHFCEMRQSAIRCDKPVDRIVYFADFQGVVSSIMNRKIWKAIPLLKTITKTVECHYPEIVDHIVLFNMPRVASAVYSFIKAFLDPITAEKIELFPGVPIDRFRELMDDNVIPVEYGGKNTMNYPQTASTSI